MLVLSIKLHCGDIGAYGDASGQWSSCHAGLNKDAKTGSDGGPTAMLGCVYERERVTVCVYGGFKIVCACENLEDSVVDSICGD